MNRANERWRARKAADLTQRRSALPLLYNQEKIYRLSHPFFPIHKKQRELRKFALRFDSSKKRFAIFTRERWRL